MRGRIRGSGRWRSASPISRRASTGRRLSQRSSRRFCATPLRAGEVPSDEYLTYRAAAAAGHAPTADLLAYVEPAARELGTWDLVEELRKPPEALRQLETGRRDGLEAVVAELVERTAA